MTNQEPTHSYVYVFPDEDYGKSPFPEFAFPDEFEIRNPTFSDIKKLTIFIRGAYKGMSHFYVDTQKDGFVEETLKADDFLFDCSWLLKRQFRPEEIVASILVSKKPLEFESFLVPYVVSIAVSPSLRSKGLGTLLLRQTLSSVSSSQRGPLVHAHILPENLASLRIFQNVGFRSFTM